MLECTVIIFGATGNLSHKKLIPSLFNLFKYKQEELKFNLIGAAVDDITVDQLFNQIFSDISSNEKDMLEKFKRNTFYQRLNFENLEDFNNLFSLIKDCEKENNLPGNRLIYLAAPADYFCIITKNLTKSGIVKKQKETQNIWHRVVYEKPFGWDLKSAEQINNCIIELLDERQIYRIDHYLTKALVNSITIIRFSNIIFEPVWNNKYIDHVQIILSETESILDRGLFYDKYGALKDVVQNHMLQLFALVAMNAPKSLTSDAICRAKCEVLSHAIVENGLLGQYRNYLNEKNVKEASRTETFAVIKLSINLPRWKGVPFYFKTGKNLSKKATEIHVVFKKISKNLFSQTGYYDPNILSFNISPNACISLKLNIQKITESALIPMCMDFCYKWFGFFMPESYEVLLLDVMQGDKSAAVSWDEIKYSWGLLQKINELNLPLYFYEPKSEGPNEMELFLKKYGFNWLL